MRYAKLSLVCFSCAVSMAAACGEGDQGGANGSGATGGHGGEAAAAGSGAAGSGAGASNSGGAAGAGGSALGGSTSTAGSAGVGGSAGSGGSAPAEPQWLQHPESLTASQLVVLANTADAQSMAVADYYMTARGLPAANRIDVTITTDAVMPSADFAAVYSEVDGKLPAGAQAFAITWTRPYRVGCMSVTSAFALGGYDDKYCNTSGMSCSTTSSVPTYDSASLLPVDDHGVRPSMMLPADSVDDAKALIDRGIAADGTFPAGKGWLVRTTDAARSVRYPDFQSVASAWNHAGGVSFTYQDAVDGAGANTVENETDILFYFTGRANVAGIDTNTYRPGAIADHLTSFGGRVPTAGGQMSVQRWLEAGATGSYGTVVEPCNYQQKFPRVSVLMPHYFRGGTLLESYWKSVQWPGEGLFVGEPLSRPWGTRTSFSSGTFEIQTTFMKPNTTYVLQGAQAEAGPFDDLQTVTPTQHELATLSVTPVVHAYYRLIEQ